MNSVDIEKNNRETFRVLLDTVSMPGTCDQINDLFDSHILSIASVLLYSEVSYCNLTDVDFSLIDAITNSKQAQLSHADYIFCDSLDEVIKQSKKGTFLSPEDSATFIVNVSSFDGLDVVLTGPGINENKTETYPLDELLIKTINQNNKNFPLGNEIFFVNKTNGQIKALSRTTFLEIA